MIRIVILLVVCLASMNAGAQRQLEILHTNDTHSCVLPLNKNLADTAVAGRGGFLRRIEMIRQEREANPDLLLFDSGDYSQGSPYYTLFKGEVEIELMNRMGYDAVTIGNHEFDFGLENMARLFRKAKFPIVCTNYDFKGTPLEGLVKPYVIIERCGLKVGVIGICPELDGLVDKKNYGEVKYRDPVKAAIKVVNTLRKTEKCDIVVCLSHLGWDEDSKKGDKLLISSTNGIDIVLGGHSHTYFEDLRYVDNADGQSIPDDQNGKHAVYVGKILMSLDN